MDYLIGVRGFHHDEGVRKRVHAVLTAKRQAITGRAHIDHTL